MTSPQDTVIVKAEIYPPIGIARVGNSPDGFYLGPEVPDPHPLPPGSYRDDAGKLKREAAVKSNLKVPQEQEDKLIEAAKEAAAKDGVGAPGLAGGDDKKCVVM